MTAFLIAVCILLSIFLAISVSFNMKHAKILIEVEDALEESLDVCDNAYRKMSAVLEIPVALNTPEVKQIVAQIRSVRDSVLYVSNVLAAPYGGITEELEDDA